MTKRVEQEHQSGCMVAVLAMIMDITYQEALEYFPAHPDETGGYSSFTLEVILAEQGYAVARQHRHRTGFGVNRLFWPPRPFGKLHWCEVMTLAGAHAVVMLESGVVLDPSNINRVSLDHPDYKSVTFVAAVTRF